MTAACGLRDEEGFGTGIFAAAELGVEVAEVWRQFVDELVEYIGVNQRVDLGVAVFYFDAEVLWKGMGKRQ